ncbi:dTDP-4-dehydrorhamnose 3,5-epimerase [Bdellovibrio sp. HCB185ZH]|uniref:dTDP-4-dehydrorhamnose 3,5-epimerase n=1 Tax=Bdellovibrio sp. HCB185ZH TaxID=3394235 RepID=UPI0039A4706B
MRVEQTGLNDCLIIHPRVFGDDRGFFYESYNKSQFDELTKTSFNFVQDNHSKSQRWVLRGIHYQLNKPQGKLVRVVQGQVLDVVVDLRKSSSTFGKTFSIVLNEQNKTQLWVPPGFGHGFVVLSETAEFLYKTTDFYSPADERCIIWNDHDLSIDWRIPGGVDVILSDKDRKGIAFRSAEVYA